MKSNKIPSVVYHYHWPIFKVGGAFYVESLWAAWVNSLSKYVDLTLYAYIDDSSSLPSSSTLLDANIQIVSLGRKPTKLLRRHLNFISHISSIRRLHYDFIYIEYPTPISLNLLLFARYRRPVIFLAGDIVQCLRLHSCRNLLIYIPILSKNIFLLLFVLRNGIVFDENMHSRPGAPIAFNFYPQLTRKIPLIMSTYNLNQCNTRVIHNRSSISSETLRILTVNRLEAELGVPQLVPIIIDLASKDIDFQWILVGSGSLEASIQAELKSINLADRLVSCGWLGHEKIDRLIRNRRPHLYVELPSLVGGGPARSAWEAMSYGIPCVLSPFSYKDYLFDTRNCIYSSGFNSADYAYAIQRYTLLSADQKYALSMNTHNTARERSLENEMKRLSQALLLSHEN